MGFSLKESSLQSWSRTWTEVTKKEEASAFSSIEERCKTGCRTVYCTISWKRRIHKVIMKCLFIKYYNIIHACIGKSVSSQRDLKNATDLCSIWVSFILQFVFELPEWLFYLHSFQHRSFLPELLWVQIMGIYCFGIDWPVELVAHQQLIRVERGT